MLLALTYLKGFNILIMRKPKFYIVESDVYCLWEKYDNFHFKLSEYSKKQFVWFNIQCNQVCSSNYSLKMAISYCRVITSMTLLSNIGGLLGLFFGFSGKRYFSSLKFINSWMYSQNINQHTVKISVVLNVEFLSNIIIIYCRYH